MRRKRYLFAVVCLLASLPATGRSGELGLETIHFGLAKDGDAAFAPPVFPDNPFSGGFQGGKSQDAALLRVSLTPENREFQPGKPLRLVLTLDHQPGSYSYWSNPGGPGLATTVNWTLPDGFRIEGPRWSPPELYRNSGLTSYVLKGRSAQVYTLIPPDDLPAGREIAISGEVATQVCTPRSCSPLRLPVNTAVVASARPGRNDPGVRSALNLMPRQPRGWVFEAAREGGGAVIALQPGLNANPDPGSVYFFDNSLPGPVVDSARPQELVKNGAQWQLKLPLLSGADAARLAGVISASNGWLENIPGNAVFELDLPWPAAARPVGVVAPVGHNAPMLLLFAFLGGLILNVMPCVFPVIGLKIMSFAKQAHKDRRSIFVHGLAYAAGVLLCFWAMSFLVITMGRGWGAQLQSGWFLFALCHIFLIMSLNMAGVFEVGTAAAAAGQSANRREGVKRSFLTGLLATITSTPCSAPFLGTALAYALSLPPVLALGVFTLMGLGFAFPYLALAVFPGWLKRLPKPGPWMETFRQAMCFPLFATTAYLFWTMEAMLEEWRFLMLLFGLVLTAMACWLYGKGQHRRLKAPRFAKGLTMAALLALAGGVWLGRPTADAPLTWRDWSPEAVEQLRREGRPVMVDFTARWCATCQVNKRVYQDEELAGMMLNKDVVLLKADWTLYDDRITATLKNEFNKAAVPVTVLYKPGEAAGEVLPELLTVDMVSEAIKELP